MFEDSWPTQQHKVCLKHDVRMMAALKSVLLEAVVEEEVVDREAADVSAGGHSGSGERGRRNARNKLNYSIVLD